MWLIIFTSLLEQASASLVSCGTLPIGESWQGKPPGRLDDDSDGAFADDVDCDDEPGDDDENESKESHLLDDGKSWPDDDDDDGAFDDVVDYDDEGEADKADVVM